MKKTAEKLICYLRPLLLVLLFLLSVYFAQIRNLAVQEYVGGEIILVFLFIAAFVLESRYTPLLWVMPNILILFVLTDKTTAPLLLQIYIVSGIILSITSYLLCKWKNLKGYLYKTTYMLYSLKTILAIYLSFVIFHSYTHPYFPYSVILLSILSWAFYAETGI